MQHRSLVRRLQLDVSIFYSKMFIPFYTCCLTKLFYTHCGGERKKIHLQKKERKNGSDTKINRVLLSAGSRLCIVSNNPRRSRRASAVLSRAEPPSATRRR